MIQEIQKRIKNAGLYPWLGAGAAIVIVIFAVVAYLGSSRAAPNTGSDADPVANAPASSTPSSFASASTSASAKVAATVLHAPTPTPASLLVPGQVLVDKTGTQTWQSKWFSAPNNWTISYTWNCGGYGGHFRIAAFADDYESVPVEKRGDNGSGSVAVDHGGRFVSFAIDTTSDCSWHVTARA